MKQWRFLLGLCSALAILPVAAESRPNIVVILVDDLGYHDLGCYGSSFYETPNLDKFAATAVRFTQGYAAHPVCSPTRASLLTGQHPARIGITDWIPGSGERNLAHYHGSKWRPGSAIRSGKWKLVEHYDYQKIELFDLENDPGLPLLAGRRDYHISEP